MLTSSFRNKRVINSFGIHCSNVKTIFHKIKYRKLGKKETSNFLARYLYGNIVQKGISNFHLNIRSLQNKVQEIKMIINEKSPHIFGISEAELKKTDVNVENLKIPGYDLLFPKSWESFGYARIVVYVKNTLNYEHISDLEDDSVQSIWLTASFQKSQNIYFCHGYREHMSDYPIQEQRKYLEKFMVQWESSLEYKNATDANEVHISLDMNLDCYKGKWLEPTYRLISLSTRPRVLRGRPMN